MYYPEDVIQRVRDANDIVDVISEYVTLKKQGGTYFGLCPFHNEKTPSFSVNQRDQFFYCFGCHAGGNVITFLMKIDNLTFPEALEHLADRAHITLPEPELSEKQKAQALRRKRMLDAAALSARFYFYALDHAGGGKRARAYLEKRQVSEEYRRKFGLGYAPVSKEHGLASYLLSKGYTEEEILGAGLASGKEGHLYDRFFNRLMFPIFDPQGRVIAFGGRVMGEGEPKYLNSSDSEIFNKRHNLYGLSIAKKTRRDYLILVEGYMDVLSVHQAGIDNAVASLGTALTPEQASLMKRYTGKVIVCYDSDAPGTNAARRAIPILEKAGLAVSVMQVPGSKDPDEYIKEFGADGFEKVISSAMDPVDFEMQVLEKQNGQSVDGQIETLHGMARRLSEIDNDMDRTLHIRDVAARMKVPEKDLVKEVNEIRMNTGLLEYQRAHARGRREDPAPACNVREQILGAMLKRPDVYPAVKAYLTREDFPEDDEFTHVLAVYLFDHLDKQEPVSLSNALSLYEKVEDQEKLSTIYEWKLPESDGDLSKFFTQLISALWQEKIGDASASGEPEKLLQAVQWRKDLQHLKIEVAQGGSHA